MCASCPHIFRFDRIRGFGTTASTKENSGNSINLEAMTAACYPWVPLASNLTYKKGALWRFNDKYVVQAGGRLSQMILVPCFTSSWSSDSICNCGCGDSYMAKGWRVPILTTSCFKHIFGLPWCFSDTEGVEYPQEFTGHGCLKPRC